MGVSWTALSFEILVSPVRRPSIEAPSCVPSSSICTQGSGGRSDELHVHKPEERRTKKKAATCEIWALKFKGKPWVCPHPRKRRLRRGRSARFKHIDCIEFNTFQQSRCSSHAYVHRISAQNSGTWIGLQINLECDFAKRLFTYRAAGDALHVVSRIGAKISPTNF